MKEKYYKFELNMVTANLVAIILLIVYLVVVIIFNDFFSKPFGGDSFLLFFILMIGYFILHEVFHGIGYALFAKDKKNIKFGVFLEKGALYAMCQECLSKKGMTIALFFPLLFLTIIAIPIGILSNIPWIVELGLINLAGASGDIMMLLLVKKLPKDAKYIDYNNELGAFFVSKKNLSKIKTIGLKCTESGLHSENNIDKSYKRFNITKTSSIIIVVIAIILIVNLVLEILN